MADDGLQFDKAEFQAPAGAPEQAPAAGPTCAFCGRPLARYWAIGDRLACGGCHEQVIEHVTGGSPALRMARALVFGVVAAGLGGALYYAVRAISGWELALVAIVVGLMVGWAVAKGAEHRGGLPYQLIAVALTYTAIVGSYVPDVARMAELGWQQEARGEEVSIDKERLEGVSPRLDAWLEAVPFAFKIPFLNVSQNFMGLIIIAIGLYEAYRRNLPLAIPISGPHDVAGEHRGGTRLPVVPTDPTPGP